MFIPLKNYDTFSKKSKFKFRRGTISFFKLFSNDNLRRLLKSLNNVVSDLQTINWIET